MGRVRRLPDITCADPAKAAYAERQAVNTVVQGTASDIIKFAMVNVQRKLGAAWPADRVAPRILMQIHDELIYEVSAAEDCVQTFSALLRTAMEDEVVAALGLAVPLVVNIHTGTDWGTIA
jgi:DNA polymerase-1